MNYNPLLPEVKANPCGHYAYLREQAPMYWIESLQCWAILFRCTTRAPGEESINENTPL
jgi:hypothetical protein